MSALFMLKIFWLNLVSLRFMLCVLPQTGYIFPDEFFQSSEVMAGNNCLKLISNILIFSCKEVKFI